MTRRECVFAPTCCDAAIHRLSCAPEFTLTGLNGETIRLVDLRGRVVFVNFWATDCEPCVRELPAFEAFMREQPPDGAVVLAVNGGESADTVSMFLGELGVESIPVALDTDLSVRGQYGVIGLPTTFILDGEDVMRSRHMGEITLENLRTYVHELN